MVYELYLDAVKTKVTRFERASRLINGKELACAVGMAYGQAGLPEPEPELGMEVEEFQQRSLETLKERALPEGKLLDAIQEYSRRDEQMDEDMLAVLKLGYESGRQ